MGTCCDACAESTAVTITEEPAAAEQALTAPAAGAAIAAEDDEFDYSAELEASSAAATAADAAAAASPQQSPRSPMLPPPPPVDDSSAHIREYLSTVCGALLEALPEGVLPARIQPAQVGGWVGLLGAMLSEQGFRQRYSCCFWCIGASRLRGPGHHLAITRLHVQAL